MAGRLLLLVRVDLGEKGQHRYAHVKRDVGVVQHLLCLCPRGAVIAVEVIHAGQLQPCAVHGRVAAEDGFQQFARRAEAVSLHRRDRRIELRLQVIGRRRGGSDDQAAENRRARQPLPAARARAGGASDERCCRLHDIYPYITRFRCADSKEHQVITQSDGMSILRWEG